jgi:hypothetical protein
MWHVGSGFEEIVYSDIIALILELLPVDTYFVYYSVKILATVMPKFVDAPLHK